MRRKAVFPKLIGTLLILAGLFYATTISGHFYFGGGLVALGAVVWIYALLRRRRALRRIFTVLLVICLAVFALGEIPVLRCAVTDAPEDTRYVIVLGAGVNGTAPSRSLSDRLRCACEYLSSHPEATAIVSGGQGSGEDISEAQAMYDYLTSQGIPGERVIKEDRATTTRENLLYSFDIIDAAGGDAAKVAVLSSEYHLYRAKLYAEDMGHSVSGIAARTSMTTLRINYFIREGLGVVYMFFQDIKK
ncbi:MAG: YdcF family protein [Oscillospiraceae bacterium]|nr:YdcF family protein [Oscillospiraceae bacterium]